MNRVGYSIFQRGTPLRRTIRVYSVMLTILTMLLSGYLASADNVDPTPPPSVPSPILPGRPDEKAPTAQGIRETGCTV